MSRLILAFFVLLLTGMLGSHAARAENQSEFIGYLRGQRPPSSPSIQAGTIRVRHRPARTPPMSCAPI